MSSEVLKSAKTIVVAAFVTHVPARQVMSHGRSTTAVGLSGQSAEFLEDIVATMPQETVVGALGSPYLILNYPKIENYISTYSLVPTAEIAAVKSLFGNIQNHARLPVTLPGIAPRGFALFSASGNHSLGLPTCLITGCKPKKACVFL